MDGRAEKVKPLRYATRPRFGQITRVGASASAKRQSFLLESRGTSKKRTEENGPTQEETGKGEDGAPRPSRKKTGKLGVYL